MELFDTAAGINSDDDYENQFTVDDPSDDEIEEITRQVQEANKEEEQIFGSTSPPRTINQGLTPAAVLDALKNNEDGDAWLFIRLHTDKFCFDHSLGKWFEFKGNWWQEDILGNVTAELDSVVEEYCKEKTRQSQLEIIAIKNQKKDDQKKAEEIQKALLKRIHELQTVYRKKNILYLATQGDNSLGITGDEWDKDPWLLACKNGVIDLRTGELRSGRPQDYLKTVVPTEWKGLNEPAPQWDKFLLDIFENIEKREEIPPYLQRFYGYGITGATEDHVIPILHGHHGRNGKGTIMETLSHALGPIVGPIPSEMLLTDGRSRSSSGPSADLMALRGRRIAWASETEEGRRLAVEKVKFLTGSDTITARPPYGKRMVEFRPTHKLFLMTNHRPAIPPTEYAMWKRIHLIPFTLSYVDDPKEDFERKRDPKLPEKLKAEASGILAWLVRGCLEWQQRGLDPPEYVKEAIAQYQEDEDTLGLFLSECTERDSDGSEKATDLYNAYKKWCELYGYKPLGGKKFWERMSDKFKKTKKTAANYYEGLTLTAFGPEETCSSYYR